MRMIFRREAKTARKQSRRQKLAASGALSLATLFSLSVPGAQAAPSLPNVDASNWGTLTAPVYNQTESNPQYAGSASTFATPDLFAGPLKFDANYYHGVIPNGEIVNPAGLSTQVGMNPLGSVLTPDGKYLITTNDDERENYSTALDTSLQSPINTSAYTLTVVRTSDMTVVSEANNPGALFLGLQVKVNPGGGYTLYASGGGDISGTGANAILNTVKTFSLSSTGAISPAPTASIYLKPLLLSTAGYVSNYTPSAAFNTADANGNKPPAPSQFSRAAGAKTTFPAGSALSPDGRYLYVACNGDNSLQVIDTTTNTVINRIAVGRFPYGVSVSHDGSKVYVANWGVMEYKFLSPTYDQGSGQLTGIGRISPSSTTRMPGDPDTADATDALYFVPPTSASGSSPQTSSISVISVPGGNPANAKLLGAIYQGQPSSQNPSLTQNAAGTLDSLYTVGETHPSATTIVRKGALEVLYVTKANSDSLGVILVNNNRRLPDVNLSPVSLTLADGHAVHGSYPNAIVASPDGTRVYVAEAGTNTVAILDTTYPTSPKLIGRIAAGWYPTALSISGDGNTLYVANAKGVGEDINPRATNNPTATGIASFLTPGGDFKSGVDSNYVFGSVQQVANVRSYEGDATTALTNDVAQQTYTADQTSIVPVGGAASTKITHVFFIEQENKTFDSTLGNGGSHFGPWASGTYNNFDGSPYSSTQFTGVSPNTLLLATTFATGVNYYSDSEESDAGHQFCASGTATDYTEKTLLVKGTGAPYASTRGLLVNKNFEPEDYPEGGYIFNNAARNGVSFKDFGELLRIQGTDTGGSTPTTINDPFSGNVGYPQVATVNGTTTVQLDATGHVINAGDVDSTTAGLGQSYFMAMPILQVLGTTNPNGEPRLDRNFPGYNFNISDQRRAKEFNADLDRMVKAGTLPQFVYIYLPNDHTGGVQAPNKATVVTSSATSPFQQVADGDTALGMVVKHIMEAKDAGGKSVYYDPATGEGSAIFTTYDDAQSTLDHIHPHRTPMLVISPYAKKGYIGTHHYVTASIVKTEELLMGLPPNNLGDLFATDLRDMFQSTYNGITPDMLNVTRTAYVPSPEGIKVWKLAAKLDTSRPDEDTVRLGMLTRLTGAADSLHRAAAKKHHLHTAPYQAMQARIYQAAVKLVGGAAPRDSDD